MAKLLFIGEPFDGRVYDLTSEKVTVGRGDHNTLAIHDPSVSLAHCEILVNDPEVIVRDLGSSNGTFVEGVRLNNQQAQLKSGQTVRFGSVTARLELDPQEFTKDAGDDTAIHELGRILRDQQRARDNPKPADASAKLESPEGSNSIEQTIIITRPAPIETTPVSDLRAEPERAAGKRARPWVWLISAVVIFVLMGLLWFLWRRHL